MKSLKDLINDNLMISLRKFEKECGVTRMTIYNIMHGSKPRAYTVKKICAYFKVDYKEYL